MVEFSKEFTSWKILSEQMTGSVVTLEVDALTCVVLGKEEEHALWGFSCYN
jgi:hypothetical protein